jgi:hypothetical protein
MKKIFVVSLMVFAVSCYTNLFAQKPAVVTDNDPGWKHIGHTTASFKTQNESIAVLGADEFTAIKLKVTEAGLHIDRLQVFYESGDMEEIDVRSHMGSGTETAAINLKHPYKDIQKVAFTYRTEPNAKGEKADIDLYGLKTNQPQGSDSYREEKKEIQNDAEQAAEDAEHEMDTTVDKTDNAIERAADKVGDGISEGTKDAAAAIKDKKIKNKVGPGGETAYVDDNGHYYYISNEGKKIYITELQLKDKPDDR